MSRVFCWGGNQAGQLGIGNLEETKICDPVVIKDALIDVDIRQVACGESHTLFVLDKGSLFSCGNNDYGQLGHNKRTSRPEQVDALKSQTVVQAVGGCSHSLCVTSAGEVFSWGDNTHGQLGRGEPDHDLCRIPKLIKFPHTVVQASCGRYHCLLLTDDGHLFSWGKNDCGQLGLGNTTRQNQPQKITSLQGVPIAQVVCGGSHSFVLSKSGTMFGWGRNSFGQLGLNDDKERAFPTLCKSLRSQKVTYISCGEDHSAALTLDGGLFTFGAGSYGQLGHNTKTHEIMPAKVMELMGSDVTQIACGRRHTLAYVADSGRLYAFGSGANGQLAVKDSSVQTTPVYVRGPFVPYTVRGSAMDVSNGPVFVINRISSGGDQCFCWAVSPGGKKRPADYRVMDPKSQIKCLTVDNLEKISKLKSSDDKIPIDLEEEITRIFSSSSSLNSSFLKTTAHYGSSRLNHGVDLELVQQVLGKMANTTNVVIVKKIVHSLQSSLFPSLPPSPPDIEALRVYLILPHLPMFEEPKYFSSLIYPYGSSVLSLDKVAATVLDLWWGKFTSSSFLRILYIFKEAVIYILQLPQNASEAETRVRALHVSLEMLKKLNEVNEKNGQIVPYSKFYIKDLKDKVSLKEDYVRWVQSQTMSTFSPEQKLLFCNYPFTFDAAAKSLLLETDQFLQMKSAIDDVHRRNIQSLFLPISPQNPCLVFHVSRANIVNDTLQQLMKQNSSDLKKPLRVIFTEEEKTIDAGGVRKVIFFGEEAQDEGGVRKEFFMLLLRELLDPKYGMFKFYEESRMQWLSQFAFEDHQMYLLIGCLCGLAIYNSVIIQLNFPLVLYKKLLSGKPTVQPTVDDLQELMPTVGRSFQELLKYEENDIEDVFCLTFEITQECFGEMKTKELVTGGKTKLVSKDNRQEFVDKYVDYIFNESVKDQFDSFYTGFHKVCGGRVLELFHPDELRSMVVGNENYDFHELEKNTEYQGEFHRYHVTIKHFWDVFHDLTLTDKKKYLLYLTGSDKIPIIGMKHVKMVIQPMNTDESFLPVAHTCFNLLDLPRYKTKDTMKTKLLQAIQQTEGFGLV